MTQKTWLSVEQKQNTFADFTDKIVFAAIELKRGKQHAMQEENKVNTIESIASARKITNPSTKIRCKTVMGSYFDKELDDFTIQQVWNCYVKETNPLKKEALEKTHFILCCLLYGEVSVN